MRKQVLISIMMLGVWMSAPCLSAQVVDLSSALADANKDGFPDGIKRDDSLTGKVFYDEKVFVRPQGPSIRIELAKESAFAFDFANRVPLEEGKRYYLTVQIKAKDLDYEQGMWYGHGPEHTILVYAYGRTQHTFIALSGQGKKSTDGWVTCMLAIDTSKMRELANVAIYIRGFAMAGTIWLQYPRIVEVLPSFEIQNQFVLSDGKVIAGYYIMN